MRAYNQTPGAALALYQNFVPNRKSVARWESDFARGNNPLFPCHHIKQAIWTLGQAYHSISDSLSSAHAGFQPWYGPIDGVRELGSVEAYVAFASSHMDNESMTVYQINPNPVDAGVKGALQADLDYILQQ